MNIGYEKCIGLYLVDGYFSEIKIVFQFYGCYFYGYECVLIKFIWNKKLLEIKY